MGNMENFSIRPVTSADHDWVRRRTVQYWGDEMVVAHGVIYYPADLPGFLAVYQGESVALATMHIEGGACELVSLDCDVQGAGIGTALVEATFQAAKTAGCRKVWLVTTNDNLHALEFYQKRGFHLMALHPGAVNESRKLKPAIPLVGENGIPIRDEIWLEIEIK